MCDERTWQTMSVDDYFYTYLRVSPVLTYADTAVQIKKLDIQTQLIIKLDNKEITPEQVKCIYKKVIDIEDEASEHIAYLSLDLRKKINIAKSQYEKKKEDVLDSVLNNIK